MLYKMEKQKRERSSNFTPEETNLLVSLVAAKKHVIENKKSGAMSWQEKEKAWKDIEKAFNSSAAGSVYRDHIHLKVKYEALKRDTRKKSALVRTERYGTGGGTSTAPSLTVAEEKIKGIIFVSVEGNESQFDSDLVSPNSSENISLFDEQESEPPKKKACEESQNETALQSRQKEIRLYDKLTEEKLKIAKIQKQVVTEELEQKMIQRKLLQKEVEHKESIQKLEKEHLLLKIKLLKKELGED